LAFLVEMANHPYNSAALPRSLRSVYGMWVLVVLYVALSTIKRERTTRSQ